MSKQKKHSTVNQIASVVSLPGYEIKDVLGKGGMAIVYLAVQKSIGRQVALKILAPDHTDDSFTERFLREARIVSNLTHPNIITIYDAGVHQGCHFMAMEYVPGKNLREARDLLDRKNKLRVIKQIAQALDYAGKKGYVHRDIKPENILLHEDGRAILTDFGIARSQDATQNLTVTGKIIGTPFYMSPEQTKGLKVDHRSDIYSLGILLFQSLAGYLPYDGPSLVAIGIKHISDPIPNLPPGLEIFQPIINICMSKKPEHRYQTAGEFFKALSQITDAELDFINAKFNAHKKSSNRPLTKTVSFDSPPQKTSHTKRPQASKPVTKPAYNAEYEVTNSDDYRRLGRRKNILWLLLLICLCGFGYVRQAELTAMIQVHIIPKMTHYAKIIEHKLFSPEQATVQQLKKPSHTTASSLHNNLDVKPVATDPIHLPLPPLSEDHNAIKQQTITIIEQLKVNPRDSTAIIKLQQISNWYVEHTHKAMQQHDLAKARQLIAQAKIALPGNFIPAKLNQLDNRLLRHEAVQSHMQRAEHYIQQNIMLSADGKNALSELQAVLSIEPDFPQAKTALHTIAEYYLAIALKQKKSGKSHEALANVELGLSVKHDHGKLVQLQKTILNDVQQQEALMSLLIQAESKFQAGKILLPRNENAVSLYKQVLRTQRNNKIARAGLLKVENYAVNKIHAALWENKLPYAKKLLAAALTEFPNSARLDQVQRKYISVKASRAPRITHILISDHAFGSLLTEQSIIRLNPTLHVGFTYTNLSKETTLLELRIESLSEKQIIINKKLIVSETTGEHIFSIKHPIATFLPGEYRITIALNKNALVSQIFSIQSTQ